MPKYKTPEQKSIVVERARQWRLNNPLRYRKLQNEWKERNKEKLLACKRACYEKHKEVYRANCRAKYNPIRHAAKEAVSRAIKFGSLKRPEICERCHEKCFPHAHHYLGYNKKNWLSVIFVCRKCHFDLHNMD